MPDTRITAVYFSPTGTTSKVVSAVAGAIARRFDTLDFTLPGGRERGAVFGPGDLVVLGVPVYAGRVPNVLLKYLNMLEGGGALAVPVVVYGNRHFDDALIELADIMTAKGFQVVAGGAFVGEHSFSRVLGKDRPDAVDLARAAAFGAGVAAKLRAGTALPVTVAGNRPYRPYYALKDKQGAAFDFRKVKPVTSSACSQCGVCADLCPMGAIDRDDPSKVPGTCIKCGACVKSCPEGAKYYDDPEYLRHKRELEETFARRAEPAVFL